MNPLLQLREFGQSVWYDNIHRGLLRSGELAALVRDDGVRGVTSNPTIFEKAIAGSKEYDEALAQLAGGCAAPRDAFFAVAVADIQQAADILRPVYDESQGHDGFVSLEVSPDLAYDTAGTIAEAKQLWERVDRPNLMIKVPATAEGVVAFEALVAEGINVNVTLLFAVSRYREVVDAYQAGLESRMRRGLPVAGIASVASFFVSRVDSAVDKALADKLAAGAYEDSEQVRRLMGKIAIANAKVAYAWYQTAFSDARFEKLSAAGAAPQRLLWASTGVKNPHYSDVLYVEALIGDNTVNTMPPATLAAFRDHGRVAATLTQGLDQAKSQLSALGALGIDLGAVTDKLEEDGVTAFAKSFDGVLAAVAEKCAPAGLKHHAAG
ncbi:MAG TPA: transaldolase [Gammaproteobacteria bacterium]|nr:transaldolase [Gammaproteobacteria bacterium]